MLANPFGGQDSSNTSHQDSPSTAVKVGASLGSLAAVSLLLSVLYILFRKKRRRQREAQRTNLWDKPELGGAEVSKTGEDSKTAELESPMHKTAELDFTSIQEAEQNERHEMEPSERFELDAASTGVGLPELGQKPANFAEVK